MHGKTGTKFVKPIDFMLEWDLEKIQEPKKQSFAEMASILTGIQKSQNKKVERTKRAEDLRNRPPKRFRQTNNPGL